MNLFLRSIDALALVYLIFLLPIPFFWLLIHPAIRFWRRFGNRSFWIAVPVWVVVTGVLIGSRRLIFAERIHRNPGTWTLGLVFWALATWIERRTRRELGVRRLVGPAEMNPAHRPGGVLRTGIYAQIRHPRYLFCMLAPVGWALLTGAEAIFLLAIVNILLYQMVVLLEERELLDHYGSEYKAYMRAVPRFVPRLWRKTEPQIFS
jgi:protein-S-isoprenylcysteine O-methyltransferase Ste14